MSGRRHYPRPLRGYRTREALQKLRRKSEIPYFRLHDRFCRRFLALGADPREFEGMQLLFPFIRDFSVLRLPATRQFAPELLVLAFLAGHDFGREYPAVAEEILAGQEYHHGLRRLEIVRELSGESRLSPAGVCRACAGIAELFWPESETDPDGKLLELLIKTLRVGFMAGSVAQTDPVFCDFVGNIPERTDALAPRPYQRALVASLRASAPYKSEYPMWHPLSKIAYALNPWDGWESSELCVFTEIELRRLGVRSETECPCDRATLLRWLADGMAYGREVLQTRRNVVEGIYAEHTPEELRARIELIRGIAARARRLQPERLFAPIQQYHRARVRYTGGGAFVTALEKVLCFADLGVWIPWVMENPPCQFRLPLVFRSRRIIRRVPKPARPATATRTPPQTAQLGAP